MGPSTENGYNPVVLATNRVINLALLLSISVNAFSSKPHSYPSTEGPSVAPDGRFAVVNVDSDTEPHPQSLEVRVWG